MDWVLTPAAVILCSTAALSLIVFGLAWSRRTFPGGSVFPFIMLAVAEWSLFSGLEAASIPLDWKILWSKLEYVGLVATPVLFLLFAARFSGRDRWLRGVRQIAWWIPSAAALALVVTNDAHGWVWADYVPGPAGSNAFLYVHGPGYFAIAAQIYAFVLAACALIASSAFRTVAARRRQAFTILLASVFPLAAGVLYVTGRSPVPSLDLIPVSFFVTGFVILAGMGFFRVFDLASVARDALVEHMSDAILVLDSQGRIADANAAAEGFFGITSSNIGQEARRAIAVWPRLVLDYNAREERRLEFALADDPPRYVDVRVSPLRETRQRPGGCLIVLRDITEQHVAETKLRGANERLEADVRRIEALQTELKDQAIRDGLTGLFNRRYLDEILPRELARAAHEDAVLSVVMIDIDDFKATNDRRGHREGDRLLTLLGALLRECTRPGDAACRYGGEEFLLVLPGASLEIARDRMETIRNECSLRLRAEGFAKPPTLSAGVAAFPEHARSDDELLQAADEALYRAKAEGRDRVCVAGGAGTKS
jgi:diguanylate cyclase (GGDEF)-like protein/PAS domain S-box-containing protein